MGIPTIDGNLHDKKIILNTIKEEIGTDAYEKINSNSEIYLDKINFVISSLEKLPFENNSFDKIFCISVLEHIPDVTNKYLARNPLYGNFKKLFNKSKGIETSLKEFARILKFNGKIILTFDYPDINLEYFDSIVEKVGLKYLAKKDTNESDRVYSEDNKLSCYRAVLQKR